MSLLQADSVTKRFAGITAVNEVSLTVDRDEIVGLIGPNGAGKTTFFNCLYGMLVPDRGQVVFDGKNLSGLPVHERCRAGIGRTFQRIELFSGMTPREHFLVAERARNRSGSLWKDLLGRSRATEEERERVQATVDLVGLHDDADHPIESLSLGRGRLVELGRALMTEPSLLLLDEPSSGLDREETREMCDVLRHVQEERNTAVLLVEHDVDMVKEVTGRLYVLDFGSLIAEGSTDEVVADDAVKKAYLGEES